MARPATKNSELGSLAASKRPEVIKLLTELKSVIPSRLGSLRELADGIMNEHGHIPSIQALLYSITQEELSDGYITKTFFEEVSRSNLWPDGFVAVSRDNLSDFSFHGRIPRNKFTIISYLYIISVLYGVNHPCFLNHVSAHLLRSCPAVKTFINIIYDTGRKHLDLKMASIINRGRMLINFLGIKEEDNYIKIDDLLSTPLFRNRIAPSEHVDESDRLLLCAIRLSSAQTIAKFTGSNCRISLINTHPSLFPDREQFLYVETSVINNGIENIVSSGFIIPMGTDVYIFQSKHNGSGINISCIPWIELVRPNSTFIKGIILTIDAETNTGPLSSRIAFMPSDDGIAIEQSIDRYQLYRGSNLFKIIDKNNYLSVYKYINNIGMTKIISPVSEMTQANTWGDLRRILENAEYNELFDNETLSGYQPHPMRSLP